MSVPPGGRSATTPAENDRSGRSEPEPGDEAAWNSSPGSLLREAGDGQQARQRPGPLPRAGAAGRAAAARAAVRPSVHLHQRHTLGLGEEGAGGAQLGFELPSRAAIAPAEV